MKNIIKYIKKYKYKIIIYILKKAVNNTFTKQELRILNLAIKIIINKYKN